MEVQAQRHSLRIEIDAFLVPVLDMEAGGWRVNREGRN